MILTGEKRIALMRNIREKELGKYYLGEDIEGWTLESIEPNLVTLKNGNETKTVELKVALSGKQRNPVKKKPKPQKKEMPSNSQPIDPAKPTATQNDGPPQIAQIDDGPPAQEQIKEQAPK